ncbi:GrpB family protein [Hymenobacter sp. BT770]|uniref:GrpB family protein n=1 Tax=Hymenobacter sp. BT770 TaxID=2886942 RepID=UPI001D129E9F|nr:GrpB family protein [Hymenobacter sp. BT770]MCC3153583.1 GrpB family protein [Hymenobacter sp. BT770]MDO3415819.1 GrpB family protein [Hymenobacter sp. BT770]
MTEPLTFERSRPVVLVPHQPAWATEFTALARRLQALAGPELLAIDHIGSTAVPGLVAKDVLDVQLRVAQWADAAILVQRLRAVGFRQGLQWEYDLFHGLPARSVEVRKLYLREPEGERRMHLHLREAGRFNARFALLFRDYLRAHGPAREEYGLLKQRAAAVFPDSIDGYLFLKEPVFHLLYHAAELWAEKVGWQPDSVVDQIS